jgi:hypothetical protein
MVDERGGDKNQICNRRRRAEYVMRDNYLFILPVRASHFRFVSKTISIPEHLSCRCDWRTCCSRRDILDTSRNFSKKFSTTLGFLSGVIAFRGLLFHN